MTEQEAWLSGPVKHVQPILMPAAHALIQAARDIEKTIDDGLTGEELWEKPNGAPPAAFQLLHIAGSIDRLLTYARGERLNGAQFSQLSAESQIDRGLDAQTLKRRAIERIEESLDVIRETTKESLFKKRAVGRMRLPTTVFGLLFHIAEHTQRHVGQLITTTKIVRKSGLQAEHERTLF